MRAIHILYNYIQNLNEGTRFMCMFHAECSYYHEVTQLKKTYGLREMVRPAAKWQNPIGPASYAQAGTNVRLLTNLGEHDMMVAKLESRGRRWIRDAGPTKTKGGDHGKDQSCPTTDVAKSMYLLMPYNNRENDEQGLELLALLRSPLWMVAFPDP